MKWDSVGAMLSQLFVMGMAAIAITITGEPMGLRQVFFGSVGLVTGFFLWHGFKSLIGGGS